MNAFCLLLASLPALAAVSGTVVNGTTGVLQPRAVVTLHELGAKGSAAIAQTTSDTHGRFRLDRDLVGPHVARVAFERVVYETILPIGSSAEGVTLIVYRSALQPGPARIGRHTVRLSPAGGNLSVAESFYYVNEGAVTWNNPRAAALRFYLPPASGGEATARVTPPGSAAADLAIIRTADANIYQVALPVRPGETRIDVAYRVPYRDGGVFHGETVAKAGVTQLTPAEGFRLAGTGVRETGADYLATASRYDVTLVARAASPRKIETPEDLPRETGPQLERVLPRISRRIPALVALFLIGLGLGFTRLYRAAAAN